MKPAQQPSSDLNKLLENTQFKGIVGEILTTGRHLPKKMHSVVDDYIHTEQCLLAETGRQWELFLVRKHYPQLVSPPKISSTAYKHELKVCKDTIKARNLLLGKMQKVASELISMSEDFGSVCDVTGFDNQAFIDAITASNQLQAPAVFSVPPQQLSIATSPQPTQQLSISDQMSMMSFHDDYWKTGRIIDQSKSVSRSWGPEIQGPDPRSVSDSNSSSSASDEQASPDPEVQPWLFIPPKWTIEEHESSSDTSKPYYASDISTWVLKEPAEGCVFEKLPRDDIHIVYEFDAARNRTGREFTLLRAEGFDDKVLESFTKEGETLFVCGWRAGCDTDGRTWKVCHSSDEFRN